MPLLGTIFSIFSGVGLLLGIMNLLVWKRLRRQPEFLFAAIMGFSAGTIALAEIIYLNAADTNAYQFGLEVQNLTIAAMVISIVWFVRTRMGTGRIWLAWTITTTWAVSAVISLLGPGNLTYSSLEGTRQLTTYWDETYFLPVGQANPLVLIPNLATLGLVLFVLDATISAVKKNDIRCATRVGVPILIFTTVAGVHTILVDTGHLQMPYAVSVVFVSIAFSLALGLVDGVARSAGLTRELASERRRWVSVLHHLELAVIHVGPDGKITYANPYLEHLMGRKPGELAGSDWFLTGSAGEHDAMVGVLNNTDHWVTRSGVERKLRIKSGEERHMIWFSVALHDVNGNPDGLISFGQDLTDQNQAEAERDATRREIEKLARVLTMGELASTIAHELSQPIAAVLSNAQSIEIIRSRDTIPRTELDEIVEAIVRDTRRAKNLMDRIRAFTYNEDPKRDTFEFGAAVDEVADMLAQDINRRSLELAVCHDDMPLSVYASRLEIQQVILNLTLNAVHATSSNPRGRVEITWARSGGDHVTISVDDSGKGVDPVLSDSVFDPFVSSKEKGTGIGLAVCRRIVERHGGTITLGSGKLGGACFRIEMPIVSAERNIAHG